MKIGMRAGVKKTTILTLPARFRFPFGHSATQKVSTQCERKFPFTGSFLPGYQQTMM
jgi:hypothetical protein